MLLGTWGLGGLKALASQTVPGLGEVSLDRGVLFFILVVSVATGVFVGVVPGLSTWRTDSLGALREGSRAGEDRAGMRTGRLFVVAQLALSLALLPAMRATRVDPVAALRDE